MPRRHAQGLWRYPRFPRAGGAAQDLRRDGNPHQHQAAARARREGRGLHGGRLCARVGQARRLRRAGDRCAQPCRRLARCLARALAGDRHDRRARAEDQVPQGLSGDRRRAGVRAGDQVQCHGGRRRALSRHGAAGVSRRHVGHAGARPPAIPWQRGAGRRRGSGDGAAVRTAVRARSTVSPGAGRCEHHGSAPAPAEFATPGDRLGRRRARFGCGGRARGAGGGAAYPGRDLAQRQGRDPRQSSAGGRRGRHLFARERQPRGQWRRSRLLHRHRDRRHDHAFLGGAQDRHARDPDRHRP